VLSQQEIVGDTMLYMMCPQHVSSTFSYNSSDCYHLWGICILCTMQVTKHRNIFEHGQSLQKMICYFDNCICPPELQLWRSFKRWCKISPLWGNATNVDSGGFRGDKGVANAPPFGG